MSLENRLTRLENILQPGPAPARGNACERLADKILAILAIPPTGDIEPSPVVRLCWEAQKTDDPIAYLIPRLKDRIGANL